MADGETRNACIAWAPSGTTRGTGGRAPADYLAVRRQILARVFEAADVHGSRLPISRGTIFIRACGDAMRGKIVTVPHGIGPLRKVQPGNGKAP
jgi:hypothetical protein